MVLWPKLSKTVKPSQVLDLGLNRLEPKLEHFSMSWPACGDDFSLGPGHRQFQPGFSGCTLLLLAAQLGFQGVPPLGFLLLRLHRLAFESASHATDHSRNRAVPLTDDPRLRRSSAIVNGVLLQALPFEHAERISLKPVGPLDALRAD